MDCTADEIEALFHRVIVQFDPEGLMPDDAPLVVWLNKMLARTVTVWRKRSIFPP